MSSVEQYPNTFYALVADDSSTEIGSFTADEAILKLVHLRIYSKLPPATTFTYPMNLIISTSLGGAAVATSDTITFSDSAIGQTTSDHLVDVTFEFSNGYRLFDGETYYMRVETGVEYSRTYDPELYIAYVCNWFEPITGVNSAAAKVVLGVER